MKPYPDSATFLERHLEQAADKRIRGMKRAGITQPSQKLVDRLMERDYEEGKHRFIEEVNTTLEHNIEIHMKNYRKRNNQIKRKGARLRLWTCPPIAVVFGLMAWYNFSHPGTESIMMGAIYTIGVLTFLGMLILGAIFDRPEKNG